jgi:hypothetical protein
LGKWLTIPHRKKKTVSYEMLHRISELGGSFGTTQAMENGCDIWNVMLRVSIGKVH